MSDADMDHRLKARTFAKILQLGEQVLPHDEMEVEVEYEAGAITQSPITSAIFTGEFIDLQLDGKHTDCLARERCGINDEACERSEKTEVAAASCC